MKKLLLVLAMWLAIVGAAFAQININTATKEQLDGLKGIGPTKAQAIIDYRTKNGPFKTVDDLEKVNGIGPGTMKDLRDKVTVAGGAAPAKEAKADTKAAAKKADTKEPAKVDAKKDDKSAKAEVKKDDKSAKADVKKDDKTAKAEVKKDDKSVKADAKKDDKSVKVEAKKEDAKK
jgi:competence protein ComEA